MLKEPISLNHREVLINILKDKVYSEHTSIYDLSNLSEDLSKLTDKQYSYIIYLLSVKRWVSIKQVLSQVLKLK